MPKRIGSNRIASLEKLVTGLPASEFVMNLAVLYDDSQTRAWANEIVQTVQRVVGEPTLRCTWWKLHDLREPGVLAGAVSKTIHADMILVAVRESEGLPLPFYFWVNAWLPHRGAGRGALVGLLGAENVPNRESGRLKKYLRAVAKAASMDLLLAERRALAVVEMPPERPVLRGSRPRS